MAPPAGEASESFLAGLARLLAPRPGRMEFSLRLATICVLTVLAVEVYQTPEPALTAYVAFFVMKSDRAGSVVTSLAMILAATFVIALVFGLAILVIDYPLWRVVAIVLVSLCLTFAASATRLKPIAGTMALVAAYALDVLGSVPAGEVATRALLYAWLFAAIPAAVSIAVNLVAGPTPRRLAERALAERLRAAALVLRSPTPTAVAAASACLDDGLDEIEEWLKLAELEKSSPLTDMLGLRTAAEATGIVLSIALFLGRTPDFRLAVPLRDGLADAIDAAADAIANGGRAPGFSGDPAGLDDGLPADIQPLMREFGEAIAALAGTTGPEPTVDERRPEGFFLPDAFTNPEHLNYALKTTGAATFCYIAYLLLDWPGIHTCFITCYIVALGTAAETVEKLTLRIAGCLLGAVAGVAALVFLVPHLTSIQALLAVVFVVTVAAGWIAAGSPRISYVGFQFAFAFFLCVIQGAAPAFDLTIARDRVIGILFGNLVVAVIFVAAWPVSVARRIDSALSSLRAGLTDIARAHQRDARWMLANRALSGLGAVRRELPLLRYEPVPVRPDEAWIASRTDQANALSRLLPPWLTVSVAPDAGSRAPELPPLIARPLAQLQRAVEASPDLNEKGQSLDVSI